MKKKLLIIVVLVIISCKQESNINYAIVSGKITNKDVSELFLSSKDNSIKEFIKVAEDGTFRDTIDIMEGFYTLKVKKNIIQLYLKAKNNIVINFDENDVENSLSLSGTGSEISIYLASKKNKKNEILGTDTSIYLLGESEYKEKITELKSTLISELDEIKGISEEFILKEKRNIYYSYLLSLNKYERYHAHYAKKEDFKVSEGYLNELEAVSYSNEKDFLFSSDYENLVNVYYHKKAAEIVDKDGVDEDIAFLKVVNGIENETIKNKLLYANSVYGITYTKKLEDFYKEFMKGCTNEKYKTKITESYNKLIKVSKGQPSPRFVNYENFLGGTTSLDDLKGKYVYIDVWATWCGPCKTEIPFLKKVEKKYHGKNIEFVSISIDLAKDHDKWKTMIEDKELKGIQLLADNDWKSDFISEYLVKGIPRFILIDPAGKIINSNAPRPSSEKLIELFNENNI
ncbi:TlpA family protein disulfide reductase [Lutibacter citreus]|uniref:TlpA family protein disulfide reductase n=1 Tax=Lutibacter citreus TaxID=2138210 RepID=UPI0013002F56|nr:TlpA disulfide reductase family protein [Lutibacter citreus]